MDAAPFAISPWREAVCTGHQFLTISGSVVGLTLPTPAAGGCQAASLEYDCVDGYVAIRLDGGTPVPATHLLRFDRDRDLLTREMALNWRAIRNTVDCAVRVTYYAWQK